MELSPHAWGGNTGIDLVDMGKEFMMVGGEDTARKAWQLQQKIRAYQESFTVLEKVGLDWDGAGMGGERGEWFGNAGWGGQKGKRGGLGMGSLFPAAPQCPKPVIAAVHGACIGGGERGLGGVGGPTMGPSHRRGAPSAGVDLVCACDIRYCSQDAWFQVKVSGGGDLGWPWVPSAIPASFRPSLGAL